MLAIGGIGGIGVRFRRNGVGLSVSEKLSRGRETVVIVLAVGIRRAFVRGGRRRQLLGGGDGGGAARGRIDLEGLDASLHVVETWG